MVTEKQKVLIIGAGLAGCEAAFYLANHNIPVLLVESKRVAPNPAQKSQNACELVCTNSLKSTVSHTGHGLLKLEMEALGSKVLAAGKRHQVPAGDALAVDRDKFSAQIQSWLEEHPLIEVKHQNVSDPLPLAEENHCQYIIIATGPLTTSPLENWIQKEISGDDFYFYDAIAPVVDADSLDLSKMYFKDRYKDHDGHADYLNAPLNEEEYIRLINEMVNAEKVPPQNFEELKYFESCLPIDTMAARGLDTARFSCMKPVGLEKPDGSLPHAVVQFRKENLLGSAYNMVGFQTRLTYGEQKRIFRLIPGLEECSFLHLGSIHRNSFLNAKKLLNFDLSSKQNPHIHFAGQITGVEGYTESASMGLYVAFQIHRKINAREPLLWPVETAFGALINYLMTNEKPTPSSFNFGLMPPAELTKEERRKRKERKKIKKQKMVIRAQQSINQFFKTNQIEI